mmetsp:Transcript_2037/g.6018  ORF Transcript_2037/g.6018 Transcript_2037/m.6018 type:complete len:1022 (-) Transcript_2037:955-4020(-)
MLPSLLGSVSWLQQLVLVALLALALGCPAAGQAAAPSLAELVHGLEDVEVKINGASSTAQTLFELSDHGSNVTAPLQMPLGNGTAFIGSRARASSVIVVPEGYKVEILCRRRANGDPPCALAATKPAIERGMRFLHVEGNSTVFTMRVTFINWAAPGGAAVLATDGALVDFFWTYFRICNATEGAMGGGALIVNSSVTLRSKSGFADCSAPGTKARPDTPEMGPGRRPMAVIDSSAVGDLGESGQAARAGDILSEVLSYGGGLGGGIAVVGATSSFHADDNTVFENNMALGGGGMFLLEGKAVLSTMTQFVSNHAAVGGGGLLAAKSADVLAIKGTEFSKNSARGGGNVMLVSGAILQGNNVTFSEPRGFAVTGGNLQLSSASSAQLYTSSFLSGSAAIGAGVFLTGASHLALAGSEVSGNRGSAYGAGAALEGISTLVLSDCVLQSNHAGLGGGHVLLNQGSNLQSSGNSYSGGQAAALDPGAGGSPDSGSGGALYAMGGSMFWGLGDLFDSNKADANGGVLAAHGGSTIVADRSTYTSNTAATGALFHADTALVTISNSNASGNIGNHGVLGFANASNLWIEAVIAAGNSGTRLQQTTIRLRDTNITFLDSTTDISLVCAAGDCTNDTSLAFAQGINIDGRGTISMPTTECPPFSCQKLEVVTDSFNTCQEPAHLLIFQTKPFSLPDCPQTYLEVDAVDVGGALPCGGSYTANSGGLCSADIFVADVPCLESSLCEAPFPALPPPVTSGGEEFSMGVIVGISVAAAVALVAVMVALLVYRRRRRSELCDSEASKQHQNQGSLPSTASSLYSSSAPMPGGSAAAKYYVISGDPVSSSSKQSDALQAAAMLAPSLSVVRKDLPMRSAGPINLSFNFEKEVAPFLDQSRLIGSGGFGDVYKMRIRGKDVAVKVFSRGYTGASEDQYSSFLQELELMGRFQNCDQIVKIVGACVQRPHVAIAYELVEGGSLADWIRSKTMTYRDIIKWSTATSSRGTFSSPATAPPSSSTLVCRATRTPSRAS